MSAAAARTRLTRPPKSDPSGEVAALIDGFNKVVKQLRQRVRVTERTLLPPKPAAAATATYPVFVAPCDLEGLAISLLSGAGVTGNTSNGNNINIVNLGKSGVAVEIGNYDLITTSDLTADVPYFMSLSSSSMKAGDVLGIELEKVGNGVAFTDDIEVIITYSPKKTRPVKQRRSLLVVPPQAAADATTQYPIFAAPVAMGAISVRVIPGAAVTGVTGTTKNLNVIQYDTAGANPVELAHYDLITGSNLAKGIAKGFGLVGLSAALDRPIKLEIEEVSTGVALPPMLVVVDYELAAIPAPGTEYLQLLASTTAAADATKDVHLLYRPGFEATAFSISMYPGVTITGQATNYFELNVLSGSAGTTELANFDFSSGNNAPAMDQLAFTLAGVERIIDRDDKLKLQINKVSSGVILSTMLLCVAYQVVHPQPAQQDLNEILLR